MDPLRDGTFSHRLKELAERWGQGKPAFLYKRKGVWWECSWREYWERSESLAKGLRGLGVKEGERILLLGPNALERYFLEMACYLLGATVLSLRDSRDVDGLAGIIGENGVRWAIVRGAEELEQMAQVRECCPQLKEVVFWDYKGVSRFTFPWALGIEELEERGGEAEVGMEGEAPCCILYSAGVAGPPRAMAFSSRSLLQRAKTFVEREGIATDDLLMPFMPSVRIIDKHFSLAVHLLSGCTIVLPEREDTYLQDLREARPTVLYFTSRTWERLYKDILGRLEGGGYLKKRLVGAYLQGRGRPWGEYLVGRPMRKKMGLDRVRRAYDIGPIMTEEVYSFFSRVGVPLRKIYWNSEVGVISCCGPDGGPFDMGQALPGLEVRSDGGRILVRADQGPEVQTGDLGRVEERILLFGREGEVLFLGEGVLSLQVLESTLRKEAFVADAFLFQGEGRLYGVIVPEGDVLSRWARSRGIRYTGFSDLLSKGEVADLFRGILEGLKGRLPDGVRLGGFGLLSVHPEELAEFVALNGHWRRRALMERLGPALAALKEKEVAGDFFITLLGEG